MELVLQAQERTERGTKASAALRGTGRIPAIVYGSGEENRSISLDTKEFEKVWHSAGESTVISLTGVNGDLAVLVQDVDVDPLYGTPIHADLYAVKTDEVVEVTVPLAFTGVAPAEKNLGGVLVKVLHEIDVEALPANLPHEIEVDLSSLETIDAHVSVADLVMPEGVTATTDGKEVVVVVQAAREEEEAPAAETDLSAIEVEKKGKETPEGEEA